MITIVSDLHLGAGGPLEDFLIWGRNPEGPPSKERDQASAALDRIFREFLEHQRDLAESNGTIPTLVFLGDTFDFWQAQHRREKPADCLLRILTYHTGFVVAVREWIRRNGEVIFVVGNHDQPIVDTEAWKLLMEVFPTANKRFGCRWVHSFSDEASGLYCEHGNRWDPYNRIRTLEKPDATCSGKKIVELIVNRLEPEFPWIDKVSGLGDIFRLIENRLDPARKRSIFQSIQKALRPRSTIAKLLAPWREGKQAPLQQMSDREVTMMNRGIDWAIHPKPGGTTGRVPSHFRFFISGHTHEALRVQTGFGVERLNSGCWCPFAGVLPNNQISIRQNFPFIQLTPSDSGKWNVGLHFWKKLNA